MSDLIFPSLPGIGIKRSRTPIWKTTVHETVSGRTAALSAMTYPRWRYKLSFEFLRAGAEAELQALIGLFNQMHGRADTFLFQDEDDNTVTHQGFGTGNGLTTQYRLVRELGGFVEPIGGILAEPTIYLAGTRLYPPADFTWDTTAHITFQSPPAAGQLTWSGQYYHRCRFDDDAIDLDRFLWKLWEARQIDFTTVKP